MNNEPENRLIPFQHSIRFRCHHETEERLGKIHNCDTFYEVKVEEEEDPLIVLWSEIISIEGIPRDEWRIG